MEPIIYAYICLSLLAYIPIYFASHKATISTSSDKETLNLNDATYLPVFGSCALLFLYICFKFLDQFIVAILINIYFTLIGVPSIYNLILSFIPFISAPYSLSLKSTTSSLFVFSFGISHILILLSSSLVAALYIYQKNWILANIYAESFAFTAIELISLDSFATGFMVLGGLFFYDIFWVFGSDVMVTVAKNFDAPIKVLFPRDIFAYLEQPSLSSPMSLLGLGDIVIPGIFVALALKFDNHLKLSSKPYFNSCFSAYVIGLSTCMFIMHTYKHAQPALLYLSPCCSISVLIVALVRGELKQLFAFKAGQEQIEPVKVKKTKKVIIVSEGEKSDSESEQVRRSTRLKNH